MRRIGEPFRHRPYRDRIGAYALIAGRYGGRAGGRAGSRPALLLVDQEGELQLPGGGVDPGESPLQALHREVGEETGWRIAAPRRIGAFQRFAFLPDYGYWARKVQLIFLARAVHPLPIALEPGHTPLWLPPAEAARSLSIEGDRESVRRALAARLI
jgi:8-oxo-dGTP diphosphatase